jgi:hypothetical protein
LNFATSEPKAGTHQVEAIKGVISLLRVQKLKMKKCGSSDRLASEPLALCDSPPPDITSSCSVQVESLQEKFAAMQRLTIDIEAQD